MSEYQAIYDAIKDELQTAEFRQLFYTAALNAVRDKRIEKLESLRLVINVQPIEMDFGGEGIIIHMNDIAAMETLCIEKDKYIAELEAENSELRECISEWQKEAALDGKW